MRRPAACSAEAHLLITSLLDQLVQTIEHLVCVAVVVLLLSLACCASDLACAAAGSAAQPALLQAAAATCGTGRQAACCCSKQQTAQGHAQAKVAGLLPAAAVATAQP